LAPLWTDRLLQEPVSEEELAQVAAKCTDPGGWKATSELVMRAQTMICLSKMTNEQLCEMLPKHRKALATGNDRAPPWLRREIIACVEQEMRRRGLSTAAH
jgi:hypothetical protein